MWKFVSSLPTLSPVYTLTDAPTILFSNLSFFLTSSDSYASLQSHLFLAKSGHLTLNNITFDSETHSIILTDSLIVVESTCSIVINASRMDSLSSVFVGVNGTVLRASTGSYPVTLNNTNFTSCQNLRGYGGAVYVSGSAFTSSTLSFNTVSFGDSKDSNIFFAAPTFDVLLNMERNVLLSLVTQTEYTQTSQYFGEGNLNGTVLIISLLDFLFTLNTSVYVGLVSID